MELHPGVDNRSRENREEMMAGSYGTSSLHCRQHRYAAWRGQTASEVQRPAVGVCLAAGQ